MPSSLGRLVLGLAVLGAGSAAHAYYLDQSRNFDVRLRTYSQVAIATESSRESPPTFSPGDLFSQRNFYNPEFDANLTNYVGWTRNAPGFSLIAPDEFKFHSAWWGFYDGMFDYLSPQWRDALRAVPRSRQSSSDDIDGETTHFNDENKNPRNILGKRNRINELYLDFSKGRLFTRIGRQSIAWGEADAIVFMDVINNFDLTMGVPGIFMDLEEARIPFWAIRNTLHLADNWGPLSSLFADTFVVPGPIDTTVPLTSPAFFGFPYSQPGQDPLRNPATAPLIVPLPLETVLVDRLPKNNWSETRWGARLTGVNIESNGDGDTAMAKAYWVATYRSISNPDGVAAYAKLAGPAIEAAGGHFLARGTAAKAYELGVLQRVVVIEFPSVEAAAACHDGPAYQAALKVFAGSGDRDLRIVEGVS